MNNLSRFTSPASGANIKALLKQLNDKGAQLRSLLWLETQTTSTAVEQCCDCDEDDCDICCGDNDPEPQFESCQIELSVGNKMVLTEIFPDQINQILPLIKDWVIGDLEAIEKKLNNQGVYLEGQKPEPILPRAPFDNVNIMFLSKPVAKGDLVVPLQDIIISHPVHANDVAITLKKGTKCRVLDIETEVASASVLAHIQPEAGLEIFRVLANTIQPIQE